MRKNFSHGRSKINLSLIPSVDSLLSIESTKLENTIPIQTVSLYQNDAKASLNSTLDGVKSRSETIKHVQRHITLTYTKRKKDLGLPNY